MAVSQSWRLYRNNGESETVVGSAKENDLVLLIAKDRKRFIIHLANGGELHTHRGCVKHDDLIGHPLGREIMALNQVSRVDGFG